jgi:hypothetical protein
MRAGIAVPCLCGARDGGEWVGLVRAAGVRGGARGQREGGYGGKGADEGEDRGEVGDVEERGDEEKRNK